MVHMREHREALGFHLGLKPAHRLLRVMVAAHCDQSVRGHGLHSCEADDGNQCEQLCENGHRDTVCLLTPRSMTAPLGTSTRTGTAPTAEAALPPPDRTVN